MSGRVANKTRGSRRRMMMSVLLGAAGLLLWRALDLTLTHKDFLQDQGDARHLRVVSVPVHRGLILDRNGEPLAVSTPVDSVWANPSELAKHRDSWGKLAALLDLRVEQLERLVAGRTDREFVYLKRHVAPPLAQQIRALQVPGVALQREYRRYYPTGEVTAHVVGFTNVDDAGQEGMELVFDNWLRGVPGAKRVIRDRLGRSVEDVESIRRPHPGQELYLSLDRRVQYLAYRELKAAVKRHRARAGSVVVLDVHTGEILALVNQPSYNPNNRADRVSGRVRNRAVTDVFEPGSTIKPFTVAAGLEAALISPDTAIDTTPGLLKVGKHTVRDIRDYGVIDARMIIQKSSNVGATKIALGLPRETLWRAFADLGFGSLTGSEFPGEAPGILTSYARWGQIHRATLSYGYGLSVTPLQLARAYAAIASGGALRSVTFLRREEAVSGRRVLSAHTARRVREMLEAVLADGGTGIRARVAGYRIAGKTGTVRKSQDGRYADDRYLAVFAGLAPASNPRLVVVAVIDEPGGKEYYGGQVAAPLFAKVTAGGLRMLGVAPDDATGMGHRISVGRPSISTDGLAMRNL